jgi:hypothetical protein
MRTATAVWLIVSMILELASGATLYLWLRKRTSVSPVRYGVPGYLERRFMAWCRQEGVDGRLVVGVRIASMVNLALAVLVGIPVVFRP